MHQRLGLLNKLGIDFWQLKFQADGLLSYDKLIYKPVCLAVVPIKRIISPEIDAIWTGMLSVLKLPDDVIMTVKINSNSIVDLQDHWCKIGEQILQWQPKIILQFDLNLPYITDKLRVIRVHSPEDLYNNSHDKVHAFKILCKVRDEFAQNKSYAD